MNAERYKMPESNEKLGIRKIPLEAGTTIEQLNQKGAIHKDNLNQSELVILGILAKNHPNTIKQTQNHFIGKRPITILYRTRKKAVIQLEPTMPVYSRRYKRQY